MVRAATKRKAKTAVPAVDNTEDVKKKKNVSNGNGVHEKSASPPEPTLAQQTAAKHAAPSGR